MTRAWVRVARGDVEGALADAASALEVARRSDEPQAVYPSTSTMARVFMAAGERERALPLAEEVVKRWEAGGQRIPFAGSSDLVQDWIELFGRDRIRHAFKHHFELRTRWVEAALAIAEEDYPRALDFYTQTESVTDQAFTHLLAAESLIARGRRGEGDAHVRSALAFYRSVRASAYITRAEKLLAATA